MGTSGEHDHRHDWNVIVTVYEDEYRAAHHLLREFGHVAASGYHNVLTLRVEDVDEFIRLLGERVKEQPGLLNSLSHVVPAGQAFDFDNAAEFEEKARQAVLQLAPQLAGCRFHVRMHRRGLKEKMSSQEEEQLMDKVLLEALETAGTPGSITFDDPDAIVAIETLGHRAGVSLWTRDDLRRYPFLRLD
jgi:tRNA(Ser,Leu) C12 N-acetylase TAN1